MNLYFIPICFFVAPFLTLFCSSKEILESSMKPYNKRWRGYKEVFDLMEKREFKTIVEIGTSCNFSEEKKYEAKSTVLLGKWALENNALLFSVDTSKDVLLEAKSNSNSFYKNVEFIKEEGSSFLKNFPLEIDLLYLDAIDFDSSDPHNCQLIHLDFVKEAFPHLHERSVVMIDNCGLKNGGKGKMVVDYLLERGWKIKLYAYQVIMVKN
jgi:hypothetical protein